MKSVFAAFAVGASILMAPVAHADNSADVRALYDRFAAAQNAHDLIKVKSLLLDSPKFLWVSDGMSFWGPDALVKRMGEFQLAEIWHVDAELARAVIVDVDDVTAYIHMPLVLTIGNRTKPDVIRFLVSILCVKRPEGWRIAALFTTIQKTK